VKRNMKRISIHEKMMKELIKTILSRKKPEKIMIFGSRAKADFTDVSDIDIAIFAKNWTDMDINLVKNDLEEFIKTPLKFDVLNFYQITKQTLKENIIKEGKVIYESK
ncbi:MAG: nucleotidyltransferase domain-containing protein, partial [Elusimicrobiales bacterium]|nr:nucleotidyltransferase domain-containing protein [Elusimicrobiales bacterium]